MICSGCVSYKKNASFNILEIQDQNNSQVINYTWQDNKWQNNKNYQLKL